MLGGRQQDDVLDAINQDEDVREVVLRLARLAQRGRLETFASAVAADRRLDESTRDCMLELANEPFLATAEPQLGRRYNRLRRAISSVG